MEIKFGKTDWKELLEIRDAVRTKRVSYVTEEANKLLMEGLADAIDAEIKRMAFNGEVAAGIMVMSIDLKIERDLLSKRNEAQTRNLQQEVEDVLRKSNKPKKKSLLTY